MILIFLFTGLNCSAKDEKDIPISTSGIKLEEGITETLKPSKEQKIEQKNKDKEVKTYFKTQNKLQKLNNKKEKQLKELEFLKHRLEIKEQKLEEYTSEDNEKGEEE